MCGIIGCVGVEDARAILFDGLERLEYRGYDSAGLVVGDGGRLHTSKVAGRVGGLDTESLPTTGYGLAHTRWATHGPPTVENAHPHLCCDDDIAVAHNGIIENHAQLREELEAAGHTFRSDTDTEVVAHLIEDLYDGDITLALQQATERLEGSYALIATHATEPGVLAAARHQSPLVLGITDGSTGGTGRTFVASDVVAFRAHTDQAIFLEDGDLARLSPDGYEITTTDGRTPEPQTITWKLEEATKAGFPHFMLKEIHEQPRALSQALMGRAELGEFDLEGSDLTIHQLASKDELIFIACGSSYNAALAAAHIFEKRAGMLTRVELASEFTPPPSVINGRAAVIAVTQSGETADTLEALRTAQEEGFTTLAVTNVVGSTATRVADGWIPIRAGPEISVAATKSFTSQLIVLNALALHLAHLRRASPNTVITEELEALRDVPNLARQLLDATAEAKRIGRWLADHEDAFVLGRGQGHAVALETALKIKEISYIHAEGIAAGELKHGPLALIEEGTPVLALVPEDAKPEAMVSSMQEVAARGAHIVALSDDPESIERAGFEVLDSPSKNQTTFQFTATILGQLIAYHAAVERGTNVDKPRNLAKSVTVG